jgi:uncharacterized protein YbjT (DUF2867 family)
MQTSARSVALAGATGLVGRELLAGLLADADVAEVHALARRPLQTRHPKLVEHVVDFRAVPTLPALDEVYLALGTTIKVAGSQEAFRAVDYEANLAVARAARAAGARRAGLVSAMGANARSSVFYNRVKGELEEALAREGFDALVIAQPSLLLGDRESLGQPARPVETFMRRADGLMRHLLPRKLRPIDVRDVAAALLAQVPHASGRVVLSSGDMQGAARRKP